MLDKESILEFVDKYCDAREVAYTNGTTITRKQGGAIDADHLSAFELLCELADEFGVRTDLLGRAIAGETGSEAPFAVSVVSVSVDDCRGGERDDEAEEPDPTFDDEPSDDEGSDE